MTRPTIQELYAAEGSHIPQLPAYAWPGGYPIVYVDGHNEILCSTCATVLHTDKDELDSFKPVTWFIHYEGDPVHCVQCGEEIESAYGPLDED